MALKVIGAGFGRTGTLSLKLALEQLGFSKCHHMREVMPSGRQLDAWHAIAHGAEPDWDGVFEGFQSSVDWPSSAYWEALYRHYPESKVILTIRDPDRWYESALSTIYATSNEMPTWMIRTIPRLRKMVEFLFATVWDGVFGGRFADRAHAINVFQRNTAHVKDVVSPERLLVFQATDGWEPLCAFLGVPVPAGPYPHVNEATAMKRLVKVERALRWLPHAVAVSFVLWLVL
jgi:hypothetical protein